MCYQGDLCGCPQPLLQLPRGAYAVAAWHTGAARPSHGGTGGEHVTAHLSGPRPKGGERDPTSSGIRAQGGIREGQRWGGLCCKGTGSGEGVSAPSSSWVVFVCLFSCSDFVSASFLPPKWTLTHPRLTQHLPVACPSHNPFTESFLPARCSRNGAGPHLCSCGEPQPVSPSAALQKLGSGRRS